MANDDAQRHALAERMSSLLGLPATQIEQLIPLIAPADLERLAGMGDAEFLRESTKLINEAQRRQLEDMERQASATAIVDDAAREATEGSTPKLRPLRRPGESGPAAGGPPKLKPLTAPTGSSQPAPGTDSGGNVDETDDVPRDSIGGLRKVGAAPPPEPPKLTPAPKTSSGIVDDAPENAGGMQIDPLTGAPLNSSFLGGGSGSGSGGGMGDLQFTPTAHTSHGEAEPESSGRGAPVVARAELPKVETAADSAEEGESAPTKLPKGFTRPKKSASGMSRGQLLVRVGMGAVALVILGMAAALAYMILWPQSSDDPVDRVEAPPEELTDTAAVAPPPVIPETATDSETVEPPPQAGPVRGFAFAVTEPVDVSFPGQDLLTERTQFTIEAWFKVRDAMDVQTIHVVSNDDNGNPVLVFGLGQAEEAGLQLQFAVPPAKARIVAPPPPADTWTHVAGVYDPYRAMSLSVFVDGKLVQQTDLPDMARLQPVDIRLQMQAANPGKILVDEIRLSRGVRYTDRFIPDRYLSADEETAWLLTLEPERLDKVDITDEVSGLSHPAAGRWVSLADDEAVATIIAEDLAIPDSLLDAYAAENGEAARSALISTWRNMSDEEKRELLQELGLRR